MLAHAAVGSSKSLLVGRQRLGLQGGLQLKRLRFQSFPVMSWKRESKGFGENPNGRLDLSCVICTPIPTMTHKKAQKDLPSLKQLEMS